MATSLKWKFETRRIEEIKPWDKNPRRMFKKGLDDLKASLDKFGLPEPIVLNTDGTIIGGHARFTVLKRQRVKEVFCAIPERELTEGELGELNVRLNKNVAGEFDYDMLANNYALDDLLTWGFSPDELSVDDPREPAAIIEEDDEDVNQQFSQAKELQAKWNTKVGQVWKLGPHRIVCGRSNEPETFELLQLPENNIMLTDPPYCSGGMQESQKKKGTWGKIDSDNLSTRGLQKLITPIITDSRSRAYYVFTDWRMWTTVCDLIEAAGCTVRNMVVWVKPSPGMGVLWRTQHELVVFASNEPQKRVKGATSIGNVIQVGRSGNKFHFTQKPVEVMQIIIENDARSLDRQDCVVYDPFLGSGTTLFAAESLGRVCYGCEVTPEYIAVTLERWSELTGEVPELVQNGNE